MAALAIAESAFEGHPDSAIFVDLASLTDQNLLPSKLAKGAVHAQPYPAPPR